jgi:hypothetical protein
MHQLPALGRIAHRVNNTPFVSLSAYRKPTLSCIRLVLCMFYGVHVAIRQQEGASCGSSSPKLSQSATAA